VIGQERVERMNNPVMDALGTADFAEYERSIYEKHQRNAEQEILQALQALLLNTVFLAVVKEWAGRKSYRFHGYRPVNIRLKSGAQWQVRSPTFLKSKSKENKPGRKKKRRQDVQAHLGLEALGIFDRVSPELCALCVQIAALCPSFEVASSSLSGFGVTMNHSLLRNIFYRFARMAIPNRVQCHADAHWRRPGLRILVCIDAGRARERKKKRGRKPDNAKRQGFHSDWIAPWLLTISLFDQDGKSISSPAPIIDGSCGDIDQAFDLLKQHLEAVNLAEASEVVFCADGGSGIWRRFEQIAHDLGISNPRYVLDYTHAKQNMNQVCSLIVNTLRLSQKAAKKVCSDVRHMLWKGDIEGIANLVRERLKGKRNSLKKAMAKLESYFADHQKFRYDSYQALHIPIGSGTVESAVRRVINLRIKSPGTFWLRQNAESMLFIRSLVLTGKLKQAVSCLAISLFSNEFRLHEDTYASAA